MHYALCTCLFEEITLKKLCYLPEEFGLNTINKGRAAAGDPPRVIGDCPRDCHGYRHVQIS